MHASLCFRPGFLGAVTYAGTIYMFNAHIYSCHAFSSLNVVSCWNDFIVPFYCPCSQILYCVPTPCFISTNSIIKPVAVIDSVRGSGLSTHVRISCQQSGPRIWVSLWKKSLGAGVLVTMVNRDNKSNTEWDSQTISDFQTKKCLYISKIMFGDGGSKSFKWVGAWAWGYSEG
jgi:hypothetical protein